MVFWDDGCRLALAGMQREHSTVLGPQRPQDESGWFHGAQNKRQAKSEDAAKPPIIGALLLGFDTSKIPQKRSVAAFRY